MLFLFLRYDFYLQYGGNEREKVEYLLGKEASVNGVVLIPLTPFHSLTPHQILLNSASLLLLRPNLVAYESVVKDEEETRNADPVRGLERSGILHDTTQPRHHSTTSNRHSQQ